MADVISIEKYTLISLRIKKFQSIEASASTLSLMNV